MNNFDKWDRVFMVAEYFLEHETTIRETAYEFGFSKSTVHLDLTKRLKEISPCLYKPVRHLLDKNIEERASRGGQALRRIVKGEDNDENTH